jgi:hypothetical protein
MQCFGIATTPQSTVRLQSVFQVGARNEANPDRYRQVIDGGSHAVMV